MFLGSDSNVLLPLLSSGQTAEKMEKGEEGKPLFTDVCSMDLLGFSFGGRSYKDQLDEAIAKTQVRRQGGREGGREGGKGNEKKANVDTFL
jgi:hypothetical protein